MGNNMFAQRMTNMSGNVIREILKLTQQPDFISFAGGMPSFDAFPVEHLQDITAEAIKKYKGDALQYGTSEGYQPLREYIAGWLKEKNIDVDYSEILITSGSQQGIDLVSKTFLDPQDKVLVESPTYLAAIQIFKLYQAEFTAVEADYQGVNPVSLNEAVQKDSHKLLYLVPNFQNPTGITLTKERRQQVATLLDEYKLYLIEDDPYGELRYSGEQLLPIKSYNKERSIYLGSFSKIISPGLRVGYAVGDPEILSKLVVGKQTTDVHTSNLSQIIVYEFCQRGLLQSHIKQIRKIYKEKRDLMLELMKKYFPAEVTWTKPDGGLFIWAQLPEKSNATGLLQEAIKEKVAFIPGESFYPLGGGKQTMRLNFSNATPQQLEEGLERLGKIMKKYLGSSQNR